MSKTIYINLGPFEEDQDYWNFYNKVWREISSKVKFDLDWFIKLETPKLESLSKKNKINRLEELQLKFFTAIDEYSHYNIYMTKVENNIIKIDDDKIDLYIHNKISVALKRGLDKENPDPSFICGLATDIFQLEVYCYLTNMINGEIQLTTSKAQSNKPKLKEKYSYTWNEDISKLYHIGTIHKLLQSYFIEKISYKNFEKVFSGLPLSEITDPIRWRTSPSELLYFLKALHEKRLIDLRKNIDKGIYNDWEKAKKCFVKHDGQPFTENFKTLFKKCEVLNLEKQMRINDIVNKILQ